MRWLALLAALLLANSACSSEADNFQRILPGIRATLDSGQVWTTTNLHGFRDSRGVLTMSGQDSLGGKINITVYYPFSGGYYQSNAYDNEVNVTYTLGSGYWEANTTTGAAALVLDAVAVDSAVGSFRFELAPVTGGATGPKNFWNGTINFHF